MINDVRIVMKWLEFNSLPHNLRNDSDGDDKDKTLLKGITVDNA